MGGSLLHCNVMHGGDHASDGFHWLLFFESVNCFTCFVKSFKIGGCGSSRNCFTIVVNNYTVPITEETVNKVRIFTVRIHNNLIIPLYSEGRRKLCKHSSRQGYKIMLVLVYMIQVALFLKENNVTVG